MKVTKQRRHVGGALALTLAVAAFGAGAPNEALGSTPKGPQGQVDFWNYDARSGKKTSNTSPGVAPRDLTKLYAAHAQGHVQAGGSRTLVPAQAGQPLKRGLSDFGLSYTQSAVPAMLSHQGALVLKRGLADFGLPYRYAATTTSNAQQARPVGLGPRGGFDWRDAGVGAGFAAAMAVLLGALVVVASHRRSRLKGA